MMDKNLKWVFAAAAGIIIIGIVFGGNEQTEPVEPGKVKISGMVETVSPDTKPVNIEFIEEKSKQRLTESVDETGHYSAQLIPGRYQVEVSYTTIGGIVSPLPGNCGIRSIDSDNDNLNFRC